MRVTIGVDVGKEQHVAAAYDARALRALGQLRFAVERSGFDAFLEWVGRLADGPGELLIGVEATGHYHVTLAAFLRERGYAVAVLNPYQATQFRRSQGRIAKTDRLDAQALARFLACTPPTATPDPSPDRGRFAALRELTRFRADLARDRAAALNRLHGAVDLAFPELPRVLGRLTGKAVLALLRAYPTAAAVATADPDAVADLLRRASRGHVGPAKVAALLATAHTSVAAGGLASVLAIKVRALVAQLDALDAQMAALDEAIAAEFAALGFDPADFPVHGVLALATIVAEAGDVQRFGSAKRFLAHFGWCPRDEQTGKFKEPHPKLSKAGNRYVRRIIWMLAVHLVGRPGPYQDYFERRTLAGKNKMDSLVAVGRKLLTTLYAILKTGRPYDPAYQQAAGRRAPAPRAGGEAGRADCAA